MPMMKQKTNIKFLNLNTTISKPIKKESPDIARFVLFLKDLGGFGWAKAV